MVSIFNRITIGATLLIIVPIILWISGWKWHPSDIRWWMYGLFLLNETVTLPWGIFTHVLLCIWFHYYSRLHLSKIISSFLILTTVILSGQGLKTWIKIQVKSPRPFVVWIEKTQNVSTDTFYTLQHKERQTLIKEKLLEKENIPIFLCKHWQQETDFSFPSGHTLFSGIWTLLGISFLWCQVKIITRLALITWSIAVISGRLFFGMHWPCDVIFSVILSWLLAIIAACILQLFCKKK